MNTPEDKIISFLMTNMDSYQQFVNKNDSTPDFVLYDYLVREIEKQTGCNYIDIITYFDMEQFNKLFLIGDSIEH